jgi:hypothetical protein
MYARRPVRSPISPFITLWNWLLNFSMYALLIVVVWSMDEFRLISRLMSGISLFEVPWLFISAILLALFAAGAVHEFGHLLAGQWMHFRWQLLVIGPLQFRRGQKRIQATWQWRGSLFDGLTASLPENVRQLRWRMLVFAAGGPLASLLLALVGTAVFFAYRRDLDFLRESGWLVEVAAITAVASLLFFLSSMKPGLYYSGLPADGGRIVTLLQDNALAERWCTLVLLNRADASGLRPRDWDAVLVHKALALADGTYDDLAARIIGYQWALDSGRIDVAGRLLDEALASWAAWMTGTRLRLALEKAYFLARHRRNAPDAREWYDRVRRNRQTRPLQYRAEAAIFLAEGNFQAAQTQARAGLAALASETPTGVTQAECDWFQDILQQAQSP